MRPLDIPAWLRLSHFYNLLFMTLINPKYINRMEFIADYKNIGQCRGWLARRISLTARQWALNQHRGEM